jgi:hypothetical protein
MKRPLLFLCALLLIVAAASRRADALLVQGTFIGEVDDVDISGAVSVPGGISGGEDVSGTFSYDTDQATAWSSVPNEVLYSFPGLPLNTFSVTIEGLTWASGGFMEVLVWDDFGLVFDFSDIFNLFFDTSGGYSSFPDIGTGDGFAYMRLGKQGSSAPIAMLSSTDLPTSMADFDLTNVFSENLTGGQIGWTNPSFDYYTINFNVTDFDIAPIPEPTTMLLLGSGLVGLAGLSRKKFKK